MAFELDELHRSIRDVARAFAREHVAPHAGRWDEEERFPLEMVPALGELGFLGVQVPERYGGAGLDTSSYAIIIEELARVDGSLALTVASHNSLGTAHLVEFASEALKQKYLPALASGAMLGAWALTEPNAGSDAGSLETRALRRGDKWLLRGTKMFITQGSVCGVCVVLARTGEGPKNAVTAFAVEPTQPGYQASRHIRKFGCRSSDTVELVLSDVEVPDAQRVGEVGRGFSDTLTILNKGRISIAAMALGLGEGALAAAVKYASERRQFGRAVGEFGAVREHIAKSRLDLDMARGLTWHAAELADRGEPFATAAAMAKLYASEAASRVCNRALQIHGGYGYTREFAVERHLRDAKICEIGEGTSEIQRLVIGRALLGARPITST